MDIGVDLSGKVAIITGAGRGIGRAIALAYAGVGATVVLAARTAAEIDAVAVEVRSAGGRALAIPTNVADEKAVRALVARTDAEIGRIDLVVANAGILSEPGGDAVASFRRVVEINLVSVFGLVHAALPALRRRGGKVIVMGSGAGYRPFPGAAAYSSSKAAAAMLVRVLAVELREHRIAVNEIIPGPVRTALAGEALPTGLPAGVATEWHKTPEDVVPLALFLAGLPDDGPTGQRYSLLGRDG